MDFDNSLPVMPKAPRKSGATYVHTANTNITPIIRKMIARDLARDEFYALKILMIHELG